MDQTEHQSAALVPDRAERPAHHARMASTSSRRSRPDSTSCAISSLACGVSKDMASVRATSSCADTAC